MVSSSTEIRNLDELRQYVLQTLCSYDQLEPDSFAVTQRLLTRSGKPCGMYFCLHGPRAVKISAIWETERNTVLFYGPAGERYHRTQLVSLRERIPATCST